MMKLLILTVALVPALLGDIKILDTAEGENGPANCARSCSGVGRWDGAVWQWKDAGDFPGKVYKVLYIADCNFVSTPVITVTTRGRKYGGCPSLFVYFPIKSSFYVYSVENTTATQVKTSECDVHWIATGYTC